MIYLNYSESTLKELDAYWTAKEIQQQPQSWVALLESLNAKAAQMNAFLSPILNIPNLRIILTGAGTSAFVGESLAPSMMRHLGKRVESIPTTDLVSNPKDFFQRQTPTLLVSFARSGNSPESVAASDYADALIDECYQLAITCNEAGELCKRSVGNRKLCVLMPKETNDVSFAMTSSFSSMLLTGLYLFCHSDNFEASINATIKATSNLFTRHHLLLKSSANNQYDRVVYLGSGGFKGIAQESALKLLELTDGKAVAMHDSPLGFRHGPKAIVNSNTLVVVYVSNNPHTRKYDLELLQELQRDNEVGQILAVTARESAQTKQNESVIFDGLEDVDDEFLMLPAIVSAQMYALFHALALGNTPDNPSASGTINRVVQGVSIHSL